MSYSEHREIETEEQAVGWIQSLLRTIVQYRATIEIKKSQPDTTVTEMRALYDRMRMHIGVVQGALRTLTHCRRIGPVAYGKLHAEVLDALRPTAVELD